MTDGPSASLDGLPCAAPPDPAGLGAPARREASSLPLAVDLDGTLIHSDTLHEGVINLMRGRRLPAWQRLGGSLGRGKAAFKREVSERVVFDASLLPYNEAVLDWLRAERAAGRRIGLFTAADQSIAEAVAAHLGLFDVARGSDGVTNLSGAAKAAAIRGCFGERFAYAGDSGADMPVFAAAGSVVLVGPRSRRLEGRLPAGKLVETVFPSGAAGLSVWARALRLQHWAKNSLVFVAPVLGSHLSPAVLGQAGLLFVLLGLLASATYVVNDLLDLSADRQHPKKRFRPFASGAIPPRDGVFAALGLIVAAFGIAALALAPAALLALAAYLGITLAYSLGLKRQPLVDVVVLAGLFTLRVLAGNLLVTTPVSPWLLTFSMLFFLGLAMIKRYAELGRVVDEGGAVVAARGYTSRDLPLLLAAGLASGFAAVVIFTIYLINDQYPRDVYGTPTLLWAMVPVLLVWTLRMWHLTLYGCMDEDPVVFALRDRFSLGLGGAVVLILMAAWL